MPTGGARLHHRHGAARPCTCGSEGIADTCIPGDLGFEEMHDVLGAAGCPQRQQSVIVIAESSTPSHGDHRRVANLGQNHGRFPSGSNSPNGSGVVPAPAGSSTVPLTPSVGAATEVLRNRGRNALQTGDKVVFDGEPAQMRRMQGDIERGKGVATSANRNR